MGEHKVGTIAMIYGLIKDVELNGKCVTLLIPIPAGSAIFEHPSNGKFYILDIDGSNKWFCDDGNVYLERNLLPIGSTDNEHVKEKEKEKENEY